MMSTEDVQPNGGGESRIYEVGEVGSHGCKMKTKEYVPMTSLVMLFLLLMLVSTEDLKILKIFYKCSDDNDEKPKCSCDDRNVKFALFMLLMSEILYPTCLMTSYPFLSLLLLFTMAVMSLAVEKRKTMPKMNKMIIME